MPAQRNKTGLTIIFSCLVSICSGQLFIQVRSLEDRRPLPYASVVNLTRGQLHFTDENGMVNAKFDTNDSISISYVGYRNMKARVDSSGSRTYFLRQSIPLLERVQLLNCKHWEKQEYSNLLDDSADRKFGGVNWSSDAMNAKIAVMLRPGFDESRLKAFSIWIKRDAGPRIVIQAPMIFSFYAIDDSTMLPRELISNKQVIYYPKKEGKQTISIDSLKLRIPAAGMYVCIEYIFNERYQFPVRYIDEEKGIDSIKMYYGATIDGVFSRDIPLVFYNYPQNKWFFPRDRDKSSLGKVHGTIKFSAEFGVCKEELK